MDSSDDFDFNDDITDAGHRECQPTTGFRSWVWRRWTQFKEKNANNPTFLENPLLTERQVKGFCNWISKITTRGVSWQTLRHYSIVLNRKSFLETRHRLGKDAMARIAIYCKEKLKHREREYLKPLATHDDLTILLHYLWAEDKYVYQLERYRVQMSLLIKVIMYTAARPGSILVSTKYANTNQAMLYKDINIQLVRNPKDLNGHPLIAMTLRFNYLKGQRLNPKKFISITIRQDREFPSECPINDFLALADADNAWEHFESSADIHKYRLPPSRNDYQVRFKSSMLDVPFLRKIEETTKKLSKTQAYTCSAFGMALKELGDRAGFKNKIRPYDLRRGASNILQMVATESELCQQMGHGSKGVMQAYLSHHLRLDLQGLLSNRTSGFDHISPLRSLSLGRCAGKPIPDLPEKEKRKIKQEAQYIECDTKRAQMRGKMLQTGLSLTFRSVSTPNVYKRTIQSLEDRKLSNTQLEAAYEFHQATVTFKRFKENWLSLRKATWRHDWFEKQHAEDAHYKGDDGQALNTYVSLASGPRGAILEYMYPENNVATIEGLILLQQRLKDLSST